ncbi:MAG: aldo/keto reductase [Sorangiineae bacterium PRO1]|nr:aldo/keto reductase [Sorangiineae bacterium PRO1]
MTKSHRTLGTNGPQVFPLALGCMGMSGMYGPSDDAESERTIAMAVERGVSLLDTGDFYGMGHNEMLIGRAIRGRRERVQLSVKFGALRSPDGGWTGVDGRPQAVKNFAAYSLKRLGVEVIDVYRPARLDPNVPIEETMGAVAELIKAGYVKHAGLSEVGVETIRRAHAVCPVADLQGPGDFRAYLPRFAGGNRSHNDGVVGKLAEQARRRNMTPGQLAIAWTLAKQPSFVPVIGARTVAQLEDALAALEKPLSDADVRELEALVPSGAVAGERYAPEHMRNLDSER